METMKSQEPNGLCSSERWIIVPSPHKLLRRFHFYQRRTSIPKNRAHISADKDLIDDKLVTPGTTALQTGLKRFQFVQNGMLQRYIVYGLAYVAILVAIVIIFN